MTAGERLLRRALIVVGLSLLVGPTPGAVGSCSGEDGLDEPASLRGYCREREELVCVRGHLRREYTAEAQDDCRRDAIDRCATRFWYDSCRPTVRQTEACLIALRLVDTLESTVDEIDECNTAALGCVDTTASEPVDYAADGGMEP